MPSPDGLVVGCDSLQRLRLHDAIESLSQEKSQFTDDRGEPMPDRAWPENSEIDTLVIDAMNEHTLPGAAVGIVRDGELIYAKGFGLADFKEQRPVTADTVFRIGSISKTFTAIGLMQLWEQGKFDLDDPVNDYLKAFQIQHSDPNAPPVTFRHLLTHTSGIGELRSLSDLILDLPGGILAGKEGTQVRLDEYYADGLTPDTYPGEKWAYANHGFGALGHLVEEINGQPLEQYMVERVFRPLGMLHTDYIRTERVRDKLATGYALKRGLHKPVIYKEIAPWPAGSIFSSVNDMSKYVAALMNGAANEHGSVLRPETLHLMMERQYEVDERLGAMGLAFWLDSVAGHRIAWHGGGWDGFVSSMHVAVDDGVGAVVFCNATSNAPYQIIGDLMRRLLDVEEQTLLPRPGVLESPHLWEELCGFYGPRKGFLTNFRTWLTLAGEAEVFVRDGHLAMRGALGLAKGQSSPRSVPAILSSSSRTTGAYASN